MKMTDNGIKKFQKQMIRDANNAGFSASVINGMVVVSGKNIDPHWYDVVFSDEMYYEELLFIGDTFEGKTVY